VLDFIGATQGKKWKNHQKSNPDNPDNPDKLFHIVK
jgi:hypothetical protein